MISSTDPEMLYMRLGRLMENMPVLESGELTPEAEKWLGEARGLVQASKNPLEEVDLKFAINELTNNAWAGGVSIPRQRAARKIKVIMYGALTLAEINAPTAVHGSFINAGESSAAFMAISEVFIKAKSEILIVDPYLDKKIFIKYMSAISDKVNIKLLASKKNNNIAALNQSFKEWVEQNNRAQTTQLKIAGKNIIHDRLVIIDNEEIYILTQSFNAFAKDSPASIVRFQGIDLKLEIYKDIWKDAEPIKQ